MSTAIHSYEVRPRKDKRGVDLISDALPFGRLWYGEPNAISDAIGYAKFYSCSHPAVIRVFDESGTVIETHEHHGARSLPVKGRPSEIPIKRETAAPRQAFSSLQDLLQCEFPRSFGVRQGSQSP